MQIHDYKMLCFCFIYNQIHDYKIILISQPFSLKKKKKNIIMK